jgi:hypothetical protein
LRQRILGRAQHEFGLHRVDRERLQQSGKHAPGAEPESGACREQCGARHAGRTADHGQRAEAALVAVALTRLEAGAEIVGREQGAGESVEAQAEVIDLTSPQWSGPSSVYRPGLPPMKLRVCVARTAMPMTRPVSPSMPLGTSSASTGPARR